MKKIFILYASLSPGTDRSFQEAMWNCSCYCSPETAQIHIKFVVIIFKTEENFQLIRN